MTTTELLKTIAHDRGLAVGLVVDPTADEGERWLATVGLDCSGVGECPDEALLRALADLVDGEGPEPSPAARWAAYFTTAPVP